MTLDKSHTSLSLSFSTCTMPKPTSLRYESQMTLCVWSIRKRACYLVGTDEDMKYVQQSFLERGLAVAELSPKSAVYVWS